MEIERDLLRKFDEKLEAERCKYKMQLAAIMGRLRGLDQAFKGERKTFFVVVIIGLFGLFLCCCCCLEDELQFSGIETSKQTNFESYKKFKFCGFSARQLRSTKSCFSFLVCV